MWIRWLLICVTTCGGAFAQEDKGEVSIYCSLDYEFAQEILADFEKRTGIEVKVTPDTEANKTVGLVNKIISEKKNPRCDVYWNNEVAQTIRLKNMGLLQPYVSPNAADIPDEFKDAGGSWTGLAARARVIIYNKKLVSGSDLPTSLMDVGDARWAGKSTMAKPLTGTTMTHAAALFAMWGEEKAKRWLERVAKADIYWSRGNAMCMRDVGKGAFTWGYTDTDDANVSLLKNQPTDIVIPDQGKDGMGTLVIPNSVMIVKGAKNLENAKKLIDYILEPEVEARLAAGRSAQIPLHPGIKTPSGVLRLQDIKAMPVDWEEVGVMIDKHGPWLHRTFEGGGEEAGGKSRVFLWVLLGIAALAILMKIGAGAK